MAEVPPPPPSFFAMSTPDLPNPPDYLPLNKAPFEFRTGLRALNEDTPDAVDERIFQIDNQWPHYRQEKLLARREALTKYVCRQGLSDGMASRAVLFLLNRLRKEYPELFQLERETDQARLHCRLTGETLVFDQQLRLIQQQPALVPPYEDALDALCSQLQEDIAIVEMPEEKSDQVTYLHLCFPNHWAAQDKIGRNFTAAHAPVPGMGKISSQAPGLLAMLARRGPFERFTWGVATDTRLNHHPVPAADEEPLHWQGRAFDPAAPELYLRIERQVTVSFREVRGFLFTIRTYFRDVATLEPETLRLLLANIETMPDDIRRYKGLDRDGNAIIKWLRGLCRD